MSSIADLQLGDPSHGGALFLVPREIRDEIYRILVKGRYLVDKPRVNCGSASIEYTDTKHINVESDFSILRVSKVLSHEAKEILYLDSVFRFVIDFYHSKDNEKVIGTLHRFKKMVHLMRNVVLDVDGPSIDMAEWFDSRGWKRYRTRLEQTSGPTINLFADVEIRCHSLHLRFSESPTPFALWTSHFDQSDCRSSLLRAICQILQSLTGFHVAIVEVMLTRELLKPSDRYEFIDGSASELVNHRVGALANWFAA